MALHRKYANLPDLDTAPDIYETPELTDDASTVPTTTNPAHSDDEFFDVDDEDAAISRSKLRPDEARSRFGPANVNADRVDFSDRVDGKRKSYKAANRRQRVLKDGTVEYGDLSDDDDDAASLERRIARLQREVQEAKEAYGKLQSSEPAAAKDQGADGAKLDSLSQVLGEISRPIPTKTHTSPSQTNSGQSAAEAQKQASTMSGSDATYTLSYAPSYEQKHALAKATDFDRRLAMLESGLGLTSSSAPGMGEKGLPRALLPTLDSLEKQISTLGQASVANLDAITRRVRALAVEQDKLNESRQKAKEMREELDKHGDSAPAQAVDPEQEAKINALYSQLPTIESLAPILPSLLDRLRSLRSIHAEAATASETLDRIEKEQTDLTDELKQWRDGLEKIEGVVEQGDITMKGNMKVMEGWVKDLEARMEKLS